MYRWNLYTLQNISNISINHLGPFNKFYCVNYSFFVYHILGGPSSYKTIFWTAFQCVILQYFSCIIIIPLVQLYWSTTSYICIWIIQYVWCWVNMCGGIKFGCPGEARWVKFAIRKLFHICFFNGHKLHKLPLNY